MHLVAALLAMLVPFGIANAIYEVDIIFPRNGTTFSAASIPPIVLAVQNPWLTRRLAVNAQWSLRTGPASSTVENFTDEVQSGSILLEDDGHTAIFYDAMDKILNQTRSWYLTWSFCWRGYYDGVGPVNQSTFTPCENRTHYFTTNHTAPPPDLVAATSADHCQSLDYFALNATCSIPQSACVVYFPAPYSNGDPCAVSINATQAANIMASVTSLACLGMDHYSLPASVCDVAKQSSAPTKYLEHDHFDALIWTALVPALLLVCSVLFL